MGVPSRTQLPGHHSVRLRSLLCVFVAGLVAILLPPSLQLSTRLLCIWDTGMLTFLALTWPVILRATPNKIRYHARQEDPGRLVILGTITAAACSSLFAIGLMLHDKGLSGSLLMAHLVLAVVTIISSWLLVHTIFALHYARDYYSDRPGSDQQAEGLDFPGEHEPDYWDFLYFSFVIGMTSQVSDVNVQGRSLRRLSLLHGVLSFFFNTAILAMSINIIASLI